MDTDKETDFRTLVLNNLNDFIHGHFVNVLGKPVDATDYQSKFIHTVLEREFSKYIWLASTRVGKSEGCSMLAVLIAVCYDGEDVCNIAPDYKKAEMLFKRIKGYFENNPKLMSMIDKNKAFRRDEINLKNGSVLRCLSANSPDTLLGFGATTLIVDEAGSIANETYKTRIVRMIASSGSKQRKPIMILIGTPHVMNHFYESWQSDEFVKFRTTWEEGVRAGILDRAVVEYSKTIMSDAEFDMWFNAIFQPGDKTMFDRRLVEQVMVSTQEDSPIVGYDYYAALDVARLGLDESAFVVLRIPSNVPFEDAPVTMCFESCRQKRPLNDIMGWAKNLCAKWNATGRLRAVGVDEIGLGVGVMDVLHESLGDKVSGIKLMGGERVDVYTNLLQMIENKKLTLLKMEKLLYQFGSFSISYQSDGKRKVAKNTKMRDDLVDSLAMAAWLLRSEKEDSLVLYEPMYFM